MNRSAQFWILMAIFQVAFGLTVFAFTRQYYAHDAGKVSAGPDLVAQPSLDWPDSGTEADLEEFMVSSPGQSTRDDPAALSRRADELFANKQYNEAADLYAQLLASGSANVNAYNSLGITLHYLGRSTEALIELNEGIAVDPTYQRIWLTLGFVNSQIGNIEKARSALQTAVQMDAESDVGQSAAEMLESLP